MEIYKLSNIFMLKSKYFNGVSIRNFLIPNIYQKYIFWWFLTELFAMQNSQVSAVRNRVCVCSIELKIFQQLMNLSTLL